MIIGLLRVKNESRWISRVVQSIRPICGRVIVFDDHSEDNTADLAMDAGAIVTRSPFDPGDLDEARDKDYLLQMAFDHGGVGDWALMIDGDEELHSADQNIVVKATEQTHCNNFALRILYLWNSDKTVRVDGVYGHYTRPSLFRLTSRNLRFKRTTNGGNFHCGSVPSDLLASGQGYLDARLLHYGYIDEELRYRKYLFYTSRDPDNAREDRYRHIIQGDTHGVHAMKPLMHAGPLQLTRI